MNKMKKTLIVILTFFSLSLYGQRGGDERIDSERIKAARIAFLTERLNLDSKTAQVFWPIYNEFEAAKEQTSKKYFAAMREQLSNNNIRKGIQEATNEQAASILQLMYEKKGEDLKIEQQYMERFLTVLSPKQTLIVSQFDAEFRRTLMKRYTEESRSRRKRPSDGN